MKVIASLGLVILLLAAPKSSMGAEEKENIFAVVSKVDGKGIPRVRRAMGTEAVVGEQMELYPGDRVITDDASTVDISLHDGTIVRIGIRSEFKLTEVEMKRGFLAWVFQLTRGSLRSLVEKSSKNNKEVKMRVNTPSGTMGIRGTEVLLSYSPENGTSLFTLEGNALFGPPDCEKAGSCVEVSSGKQSQVKKDEKAAASPAPFSFRNVLAASGAPGVDLERLALFQPVARANTALVANLDDNALGSAIGTSRAQLQEAQNTLLDRSENLRLAMDAARRAGTFERILRIAEAHLRAQGVKVSSSDIAGMESGAEAVKKFELGKSIIQSGAFGRETKEIVQLLELNTPDLDPAKADPKRVAAEEVVLSAGSPVLKAAEAWAVKTEAATEAAAKTGTPVVATKDTRAILESEGVKTSLIAYAETLKVAAEQASPKCGKMCRLAKAVAALKTARAKAAALAKVVVKKQSKKSKANADAAAGGNCQKVTVCEYEPCDTSKGNNCNKEKVCRTTCK